MDRIIFYDPANPEGVPHPEPKILYWPAMKHKDKVQEQRTQTFTPDVSAPSTSSFKVAPRHPGVPGPFYPQIANMTADESGSASPGRDVACQEDQLQEPFRQGVADCSNAHCSECQDHQHSALERTHSGPVKNRYPHAREIIKLPPLPIRISTDSLPQISDSTRLGPMKDPYMPIRQDIQLPLPTKHPQHVSERARPGPVENSGRTAYEDNHHYLSKRPRPSPDTDSCPPSRYIVQSSLVPPSEEMPDENRVFSRDLSGKLPQRSPSPRSDANAGALTTRGARPQIPVMALKHESPEPAHEDTDGREVKASRTLKRESMTPDLDGTKMDEPNDGEQPRGGVGLKRKFATSDKGDKEAEIGGDDYVENVFFPAARREHVKQCFSDIMDVADSDIGVHPMPAVMFDIVMRQVEMLSDNISRCGQPFFTVGPRHKRRKLGG